MPARPYAAITTISTPDGLVYIRKSWAAKQSSFLLILDGPTAALSLLLPDWRPKSSTSTRTQVTPPTPATSAKEILTFAHSQIPIWTARANGKTPVTTSLKTIADCITATECAIASTIRPSSLVTYKKLWQRTAKFIPINTKLSEINKEKIQSFISMLAERGSAATSIRNAVTGLHRVLGPAIDVGLVSATIFQRLNMPRPIARPRNQLSREQRDHLLHVAAAYSQDIHLLFALGLCAGLRRGELLALRWGDLDLNAKILRVQNSDGFLTKSGRNRTVPISNQLLALLTQARPVDVTSSTFVLMPDKLTKGAAMRWAFSKSFKTVVKKAGVPWMSVHAMRRAFSTLAVQAGVSIWKLKNWLGHGSVSVTERAYCSESTTFDADVNKVG